VVDGEDVAQVAADIEAICHAASPLPVTVEQVIHANAFFQDPTHPWVGEITQYHANEATIAPYGTNAYAYTDLADCCVVYGPGSIAQAHTADEWIEVAEIERAAGFYRKWLLGAE
jgi:acetylornithine deacetylase